MIEIDSHFNAYEHLKDLPREQEALHALRKAASLVKPIMRKRGWKVGTLCEFLPPDSRLQGLNVNKTERILVRLRHTSDPKQFIPFDYVIDTLLHELSHIIFGPHDEKFHALWNELRAEHQTLVSKGYSGEGFLSKGKKLGGRRVPMDEIRRQARVAAEKRHKKAQRAGKSAGQRLGGSRPPRGADIRRTIADAATRRNSIVKGCASGTTEGVKAAEEARRNGFRTKAEEDDANDAAIMKALIDLMEEDEMDKLENKDQGLQRGDIVNGLSWTKERGLEPAVDTHLSSSLSNVHGKGSSPQNKSSSSKANKTHSSSISKNRKEYQSQSESEAKQHDAFQGGSLAAHQPKCSPNEELHIPPKAANKASERDGFWICSICTLENPFLFLCCDACGTERPALQPATDDRGQKAGKRLNDRLGWNCGRCGTFMENQWWTCSACGVMKGSS